MTTRLTRWRLFCETENEFVYTWLETDEATPTTCPNNTGHTVDATLTTAVDTNVTDVNNVLSAGNSTTTPLTASSTYYGDWENILNYASASVFAISDQISTLSVQRSTNGTDVDRETQLSDGLSGDMGQYDISTYMKYFRVKIVCGGVNQTYLRVQTMFQIRARISIPTSHISQGMTSYSDCLNSRSVIFAYHDNETSMASVNITSKNLLKTTIQDPVAAFGDIITTQLTPRIQIDAVYGIIDTDMNNMTNSSGTCTSVGGLFIASTGTTPGGYAAFRSRRLIRYMPGLGIRVRFNARFTSPVVNSLQAAGAFTATDGLLIGYKGTVFGVMRRVAGAVGIYKLTFTAGTTGSTVHTITLNGTIFTYTSSGTLSTNELTENIAENKAFTGYIVTSNGATLSFGQFVPATASGEFSYSSDGASTGSFTTVQTGIPNDITTGFVAQTDFNHDKLDGSNSAYNPTGMLIDPTKLYDYQIVYGSGAVNFYVMNLHGDYVLMHTISHQGTTTLNQVNPTFRIGWISASLGSTTDMIVYGSTASAFIEGTFTSPRNPSSFSNSMTASLTEHTAICLRVRRVFMETVNNREIIPIQLSIGLESGDRLVTCRIYLNPTLTGFLDWGFVDETRSNVEKSSTTTITPTGGELISSFVVSGATITDLSNLAIRLAPGDIIAISLQTASSTTTANISINWNAI